MKKIFKNMMFYAILIAIIFIVARQIINDKGMEFRNWVYIAFAITMLLFLMIGFIQIICKMHDVLIKSLIIMVVLAINVVIFGVGYFIYDLYALPENTVTRDDKTLLGYGYSYVDTKVNYYEYINVLVRGKEIVLTERYR